MRSLVVLGIVAIAQLAFAGLLVVLLLFNRLRRAAVARHDAAIHARVAEPLHAWLIGVAGVDGVLAAMRALRPERALEQLLLLRTMTLPGEQQGELAAALRHERWVGGFLQRVRSRLWWRRLQAARLLSIVGTTADRALVLTLLDDRHPAVQTAATNCLVRCADEPLIARVLRDLPTRPTVVRLYQCDALKRTWRLTTPTLLLRLADPTASAHELEVMVNLVEFLATADVVAAAVTLREHPAANVRLAVAKVLKKYFHPDALGAAFLLLGDPDWRVRGQAARALGVLGSDEAIPMLLAALEDRSWWVRFRAGLALAQLGEQGRAALRRARDLPDRYAAEMARMVSGLSDGGLVELSEA